MVDLCQPCSIVAKR